MLHCDKTILQIDVSFLCVCPVIDHEFRHHIVKVAVDLTMKNCRIVGSRSLTRRMNFKFICHVSVRILTIKISQ